MIFDKDTDPKLEVSYVKNEPLEYKINLFDSGTKAVVEIKIKVLTSQHEDMLFRVQLCAVDPVTLLPLEAVTKPIKVISKLTHVKKAQSNTVSPGTPTASKKRLSSSSNSNSSTLPTPSATTVLPTGITYSSQVLDNNSIAAALTRIEQTQQNIVNVLSFIARRLFPGLDDIGNMLDTSSSQDGTTPTTTTTTITSNNSNMSTTEQLSVGSVPQPTQSNKLPDSQEIEIDEEADIPPEVAQAFRKFVDVVSTLPPEEKTDKIIDVVHTLSGGDTAKIEHLWDKMQAKRRRKDTD